MNKYIIHHKVKAIANLGFDFQHGGYHFAPFETEKGFASEEWLASRELEASGYHEASVRFRQDLVPILGHHPVLLHAHCHQTEDLERLLKVDNKVALHYLRESNNSSTAKTRLAMLVIAAGSSGRANQEGPDMS